jgi:uncharacterized protein (TIGR03067 family)
MSRFLTTVLAVSLFVAGSNLTRAADKDDKNQEGTWEVTSMTVDGKEAPKSKEKMLLIIKDNTYTIEVGGKTIEKGKYKLDTSKTPYLLDVTPEEGADKGKTMKGLCEIKGDEMRGCFTLDGKDRPKELASKAGSGMMLVTYKRVK